MIQPITSHQAIAGATRVTSPVTFGNGSQVAYQNQMNSQMGLFQKGEKLDINCCGTREYSLCGQKLNFLA